MTIQNVSDSLGMSRSLSCPPKSIAPSLPPKKDPSSHISYEPDYMYNNHLSKRPNIPANKQVINLSQYLSERANRDSDCESQDGYSDGGTTTSGSYCMDEDEDLAHDVLV